MTAMPRSSAAGSSVSRRRLVKQRIAARDQHQVNVGVGHEAREHLGLVHANADRAHASLRAQLLQCRVRLAQCLLAVIVRIVNERDVDVVKAEPAKAVGQAPPDAVGAEVKHPAGRGRYREALRVTPEGLRGGLQQPANLSRDHVLGPWPVPQRVAKAPLGQAQAVMRRGIKGPDAAGPGRVDRGPRVLVFHLGKQVADRRPAERVARSRRPASDRAGAAAAAL